MRHRSSRGERATRGPGHEFRRCRDGATSRGARARQSRRLLRRWHGTREWLRMQLTRSGACTLIAAVLCGGAAHAQVQVGAGASVFREAGGSLDMVVFTPEVNADIALGDRFGVTADWTAD